jgi:hypothetical protein
VKLLLGVLEDEPSLSDGVDLFGLHVQVLAQAQHAGLDFDDVVRSRTMMHARDGSDLLAGHVAYVHTQRNLSNRLLFVVQHAFPSFEPCCPLDRGHGMTPDIPSLSPELALGKRGALSADQLDETLGQTATGGTLASGWGGSGRTL